MEPLIISCALSGGLETPEQNPNVPFNPEAIGKAAVEAWREGAAVVHIHARDEDGEHSGSPEVFGRILDVIRDSGCDAVVNLTTSHASWEEDVWEERFAALELHTDLASYDCGTMNFNEGVFYNRPDFLQELGTRMRAAGVVPELEIFDVGMIGNAIRLRDEGFLDAPLYFQFVLGVRGGAPAEARVLAQMVDMLPEGSPWSACGVGRHQLPINAMAIAMGGHTRTGLEDNTLFRKGEVASNPQLVARVRRLSELMERPVATPAQAREILHLDRYAGRG
jgi:3-keto-5-aminohexanoate cleavage enzyme